MERSHPSSGRSATPADINRNGRPTSIGTGGRHQSECPADFIGIRTVYAKTAVAELAESALRRICRVIGGGTFSRSSPFGHWYEDVRALGFLRPPWGLAYDRLFAESWLATES